MFPTLRLKRGWAGYCDLAVQQIKKGALMMDLYEKDPEFAERFAHFAFREIVNEESRQLDPFVRDLAVLAALIGCGGVEVYKERLSQALENGVAPIAVKEMTYQAAAYLGYGRMLPFLNAANALLSEGGIRLPLEGQATTTLANRLEKGAETQAEIFGAQMKKAWRAGRINRLLAANCFGDYYTRKGLALSERELITFCFLMAQGGCEPQLIAHAKGNMNLGNDRDFLIEVVLQCLPYIGYPRSLNAISCIEKAAEQ